MKFVFLILLHIGAAVTFGQTKKIYTNGIKFSLPQGFNQTNSTGGEFATFNRDNKLQIAFANGCNTIAEENKLNLNKELSADLCFETLFVKMKSTYGATWSLTPKDTVIKEFNCKWAELHSTIEDQDYYLIYVLMKGKKYMYEIMLSGHLANKKDDLDTLRKIMSSYKER
jgi:hypothetical protein